MLQRIIAKKAIRLGWLRLIERAEQIAQDRTQSAAPGVIQLPTQPVLLRGSDADGA